MKYLTDYETKAAYDAVKKDLPKPQIALVRDSYSVHFAPKKVGPEYDKEYFTIIANGDGAIKFEYSSNLLDSISISYSINDGSWVTIQCERGNTIYVDASSGDKIRWKSINDTLCYWNDDGPEWSYFQTDFEFEVEGNPMSLLYGDDFVGKTSFNDDSSAVFGGLFRDAEYLISAKNLSLPATELAPYFYWSMFSNCRSLTTAPELPATTLAFGCYESMFSHCTSLTTAPELPATTLANSCYQGMFNGCTKLTTAPQLPATTLTQYCYYEMFNGCSSLTEAPQLPATTLAYQCCSFMFSECTSLTTAPELLATTLAEWCYNRMFYNCNQLNYIKCLATDISASYCTDWWVYGVASSGTFIRDANTSWPRGYSGIPNGWEVEPPLTDK